MINLNLINPLLAMLLLPILVATKLFLDRLSEMKAKKIHPQRVATRQESQSLLLNSNANDNLKNLFELPIIFYVITVLNILLNVESSLVIGLSWLFVVLRYTHSFIHCTYNKVMHRFYAFLFSTSALSLLLLILIFTVAKK